MQKPKILKTELVRNRIHISIIKTEYLFDIIAEGGLTDLEYLKEKLDLDSIVIEKGIFGKSLIVVDTCDEFSDAKLLMKDCIWGINKKIEEWK